MKTHIETEAHGNFGDVLFGSDQRSHLIGLQCEAGLGLQARLV